MDVAERKALEKKLAEDLGPEFVAGPGLAPGPGLEAAPGLGLPAPSRRLTQPPYTAQWARLNHCSGARSLAVVQQSGSKTLESKKVNILHMG